MADDSSFSVRPDFRTHEKHPSFIPPSLCTLCGPRHLSDDDDESIPTTVADFSVASVSKNQKIVKFIFSPKASNVLRSGFLLLNLVLD